MKSQLLHRDVLKMRHFPGGTPFGIPFVKGVEKKVWDGGCYLSGGQEISRQNKRRLEQL